MQRKHNRYEKQDLYGFIRWYWRSRFSYVELF
jgi:hypothetical protein